MCASVAATHYCAVAMSVLVLHVVLCVCNDVQGSRIAVGYNLHAVTAQIHAMGLLYTQAGEFSLHACLLVPVYIAGTNETLQTVHMISIVCHLNFGAICHKIPCRAMVVGCCY